MVAPVVALLASVACDLPLATDASDALAGRGGAAPGAALSGAVGTDNPEGWRLFVRPEFMIGLPDRWEPVELDAESLEGRIGRVAARSPAVGALLRDGLGVPTGTRFLAFDVVAAPRDRDSATSVFVTGTRRDGTVLLDEYVNDGVRTLNLRPDVVSRLSRRRIRLPAGQAHEVRLEMARPAGVGAVFMAQYFLLERGTLYTIAFATDVEATAAHLPDFERIARSFTLR